jgi:hypothetical protein
MMRVPEFLLRRLYVKGSLQNTRDGFKFELKNSLGSGYARRMLPLSADGKEISLESCSFTIEGKEMPFSAISPDSPLTLAMNRAITVNVRDTQALTNDAHKIGFGFEVAGFGALRFHFTDVPSN